MEERRKIVIPVGREPEPPHFDAEETLLSARPVVPIARQRAAPTSNGAINKHIPFYRRYSFLALVVFAAIGIGLAAGLSIARYRYQQRGVVPAAAQQQSAPVINDARTATVPAPKSNPQTPPLPEVKPEEKATIDDDKTDEDAQANAKEKSPGASAKAPESSTDGSAVDKGDNSKTTTPRDKKRAGDDEENGDAPRAQRRDRKRRADDEDPVDLPRRIERASEQINRIREIFEGRQQRP